MDNNISFAKIVATPTLNSWSQAYNAGKLFAVLSLERTTDPLEVESLNMLGKDLLERLEQEFFVIEDKNLESIKKAIFSIFENEIKGVNISFAASAIVGNILYLFCLGNSRVFIKREGNLGLILDCDSSNPKNVVSSSGFLKDKDLITLTTDAFSDVITQEELNLNLDDAEPTEIAESLAPKIHKAENGKISAIIIKYKNPLISPPNIQDELIESEENEATDEKVLVEKSGKTIFFFNKLLSFVKSKLKKPNFKIKPTKKLFLVVAIVIVIILITSIFTTINEQNNAKIRNLFAQIYPQAQKKYDEGQGLLDLNKNFARDSFLAAQKILSDNKDKFPAKSKEATQTQDLLKKIEDGLAQVSPIDKSGLDRSKLSIMVENGSGIEGTAGKAANILKDLGYSTISTGNADNYNYQGATIKVKKEKSDFLNLLKTDLSKTYTITASSSDLSSTSSTDAIVIIGK
jgi:hypothetical protein